MIIQHLAIDKTASWHIHLGGTNAVQEGQRITAHHADLTKGAVIAVMGPKSRTLLSACSPHDFSNESFAFGGVQEIEIGMGLARAHRVSYVGELGWEIYCSSDQAGHIYEAICEAGQDVSLKPCGMHVLDSCRLEKAFRHFGHDISDEDHIVDAGLSFAVAKDKTDLQLRKIRQISLAMMP